MSPAIAQLILTMAGVLACLFAAVAVAEPELAKRILRLAFEFLVPHFVVEDVALNRVGRSSMYEIVCCMDDVAADEEFDAVATLRSFTWLGAGFFPKQIGPTRPWVKSC